MGKKLRGEYKYVKDAVTVATSNEKRRIIPSRDFFDVISVEIKPRTYDGFIDENGKIVINDEILPIEGYNLFYCDKNDIIISNFEKIV